MPGMDDLAGQHAVVMGLGGFGGGVYVDYNEETSHTYGSNTYALRLLLHDHEIFELEPSFIGEGQYNSILVGEQVPPFQFSLKGTIYTVADEYVLTEEARISLEAVLSHVLTGRVAEYDLPQDLVQAVLDYVQSRDDGYPDVDDLEWDDDVAAALEHLDEIAQERVFAQLEEIFDRVYARVEARFGLLLDMDEIGREVKAAGYKALYVPDLRPLSELLVFDADDLEMLSLVESRRRF